MKLQKIKVVASKDFRFVHVEAGLDGDGLGRTSTETHEEAIFEHFLRPAIEEYVLNEWPDMRRAYKRGLLALRVEIQWV